MTAWQRRARLAIAISGLMVAVLVFLAIRRSEPRVEHASEVRRADPTAVVESTRGVLTQTNGAHENFKVEFDRQLGYEAGRGKLVGVKISVDNRDGRDFVVTGKEAVIGADRSNIALSGKVRLTASDGLVVVANQATYSDGEGIVRAPGKVAFERGGMKGIGVGMTYDKKEDVLSLHKDAIVKVAEGSGLGGAVEVHAGSATFARADRYLLFTDGVKILREGRVAEANEAVAYLSEEGMSLTALELRGNSRITGNAAAAGSFQSLAASEMNLVYAENGQFLQHVTMAGGGGIEMAGEAGQKGTRIGGDALEIGLAADGATVTSLSVRDNVQTLFPASGETPAKSVRAASLEAVGEETKGLSAAKFTENVEYVELLAGKPPVKRIVRAQALEADLKGGMSNIDDARFAGAVRFEEAELKGSAASAHYRVGPGVVELSGLEGKARPRLVDDRINIDADRIELTLQGRKMNATTDVRSVLQPARDKEGDKSGAKKPKRKDDDTHLPGMLDQREPVNVTGATLVYDEEASHAVYTGKARLWQADTTIIGDTITIDDKTGNLTAVGSVRSSWMTERQNEETGKPEKRSTIGSAAAFAYDDDTHRATYTTNAHVNGDEGDLVAKKIELYMKPGTRELERMEAYEAVTVRLDKRVSTGERMTHFASEERYVMSGGLVKIVEECRETTGRTLTFFKSTDRIIVDGNEERRTHTTSGGDCSDQRPN